MYNAKPEVAAALSADHQLTSIIPKTRMFDGEAIFSSAPVYPYLTYEELSNIEANHADNEEIASQITFRIHLWGTSSLSTAAEHIDRVLKSIGFGRNYFQDQNEVLDTGQVIKHKIGSYTNIFLIEP